MLSRETRYQIGFTPHAGWMTLITVATVVFGQAAGCGGGAMTAGSGSPNPAGTGGSLGGSGGPSTGGTVSSGSPSTGGSGGPSTGGTGGSGSPSRGGQRQPIYSGNRRQWWQRRSNRRQWRGNCSRGGSAGAASGIEWVTIHNDFFWYDADGKRITCAAGLCEGLVISTTGTAPRQRSSRSDLLHVPRSGPLDVQRHRPSPDRRDQPHGRAL